MDLDRRGLIGTIIFHAGALLLFILFGFRTPLPLPGEEGILINFGDVDMASGPAEPRRNEQQQVQPRQESAPMPEQRTPAKDAYITQDTEEAPSMPTAEKPKQKIEKKESPKPVETKPTVQPHKKVEEKKEVKPTVDTRAMYRGKKTDTDYSGSEGVNTGSGNQGSPSGSENALDRSLGGGGDGITTDLAGRNALSLPSPEFNVQKEGKVVVEIQVDRSGKVISAVPGVKGSTTLDSYLLAAAKRAALASRFDNKQDAQAIQTGKITYNFRLK
jgi:TonB family protein